MDRRMEGWCPWGWPGLGLQPPVPPGTLLLQDGSRSKGMCLQRGCCGRSCAEPDEFSPKHAIKNPIMKPRGQQHPRLGAWQQGRALSHLQVPLPPLGAPGWARR